MTILKVTGLSSSGSSRTAVRTWRSPMPTRGRRGSDCGGRPPGAGRRPSWILLSPFEQLCVEGHNLHPGAKTKTGMEPEAVYRYAPEFDGTPDLRLVGIRRDRTESASLSCRDMGQILFNQHPGLREAVAREFVERGLSPTDYLFVPVHPWQLKNVVPEVYRAEISQKVVVPVEGTSVPGRATSSFRTVVPRVGR